MIDLEFARRFSEEWIASWNSRDLERILSHYAEDFTIETPMAQKIIPGNAGLIEGKEAVKQYWKLGLERIPDLKFELLDLLVGVNGLTIYYRNTAIGKRSVEVMSFNQDRMVDKAVVHYSE